MCGEYQKKSSDIYGNNFIDNGLNELEKNKDKTSPRYAVSETDPPHGARSRETEIDSESMNINEGQGRGVSVGRR